MSENTPEAERVEPTVYRFKDFQELLDVVPAERFEDCVTEIAQMLCVCKTVNESTRAALAESGQVVEGPIFKLPDVLEWIDDGKGEIGCRINDPNGQRIGEVMLSDGAYEVSEAP